MNSREFKALREQAGMTQVDAAARFGVDVRTVGRWEQDELPISAATEALIRLLAHPQGARLADLIYGKVPAAADPLADLDYDQSAHDLRNLRAGRAPTPLPPGRATLERTPERRRSDDVAGDPLAGYDYDRDIRAARKRGPQPRVAKQASDPSDPLDGYDYDAQRDVVRAARERRAKGDDE